MKAKIRLLIAFLFLPLAWLAGLCRPGVRILMYHRVDALSEFDQLTVSPDVFQQQMALLSRLYRVVPLTQALAELESGRVVRNTVVITFDDGYLDNLTLALPILEQFSLPATVFITSDFAAGSLQHPRYSNTPNAARLHMNWDEVKQWLRFPSNEIGAHSCSHPYLQRLSDAQCRAEISNCQDDIVKAGVPHNGIFCYPSGDVSEREANLVASSGYTAAVTVAPGVNYPSTNRFWLHRTEVTDKDSPILFRLKLAGCFDLVHEILHRRRVRQFSRQSHAEKVNKGVSQ